MILENVRVISTPGEFQGVFSKFEELRIYYDYLEEYLKQYYDKIHEKYKDEYKKYPNNPNLGGVLIMKIGVGLNFIQISIENLL